MIGLSLSLCIADVLAGRVEETDIERIVSATRCRNEAEFLRLIDQYCRSYWADNPELGSALAWYFWSTDKLDQPRLRGEAPYLIVDGKYTSEEGLKTWPRMA